MIRSVYNYLYNQINSIRSRAQVINEIKISLQTISSYFNRTTMGDIGTTNYQYGKIVSKLSYNSCISGKQLRKSNISLKTMSRPIDFYWVSRQSGKSTPCGQNVTKVSKQTKTANWNDSKWSKRQFTDKNGWFKVNSIEIGMYISSLLLFCHWRLFLCEC